MFFLIQDKVEIFIDTRYIDIEALGSAELENIT